MEKAQPLVIAVYVVFLVVVFAVFYSTDRRMVALFVAIGTAVLVGALRWIRGQ
jgi:hypothetical protein